MPLSDRVEDPGSGHGGHGFGAGVSLLFEGVALLRRERRLWLLAAVPVGFALLFVGSAVSVFWLRLEDIHGAGTALLPVLEAEQWWTWIWVGPGLAFFWLLGWLAVTAFFAVSVVAALLLANLASAPFLDRLSERVEAIALGQIVDSGSGLSSLVGSSLRSFVAELQRIAFLGFVWLVLTGIGFVLPGAHFVTGPLLVAVTILFLPLDYAGFALDRRQVGFRGRRAWLVGNLSTMVGFGAVAFGACLVPGLNLLLMPVMVTAGTLLVTRRAPGQVRTG